MSSKTNNDPRQPPESNNVENIQNPDEQRMAKMPKKGNQILKTLRELFK